MRLNLIFLFELNFPLLHSCGFTMLTWSGLFLFFATYDIIEGFNDSWERVDFVADGEFEPLFDFSFEFFDFFLVLSFNLTLSLRNIPIMPLTAVKNWELFWRVVLETRQVTVAFPEFELLHLITYMTLNNEAKNNWNHRRNAISKVELNLRQCLL